MARGDAEENRYGRCDVACAGFQISEERAELGDRFWLVTGVVAAATTVAKLDEIIGGCLFI